MLDIFKLIGSSYETVDKYLSHRKKWRHDFKPKKKADLSLEQEVSANSALVGDEVTFTVTLNNDGPAKAKDVKVKDLLPEGFELTDFSTSLGSYDPHTGIWQVRKIAAHSHATLTLTADVVQGKDFDDYTNVAEIIAAKQFDPDSKVNNGDPTEDDYTSLSVPIIDLSLEKEFTNTQIVEGDFDEDGEIDRVRYALPGDEVSFEITVTNNGANEVTGVTIFDDLTKQIPIGLEFISFSDLDGGTSIDSDNNAQTIEVLFDSIADGESKTITVNAKVSTENITAVDISGLIGTIDPTTGTLNQRLPEYYQVPFDGRFFLHLNLEKSLGESEADFGFLNFNNTAEITSVNHQDIESGSITASANLDISTYEIRGNLNNNDELLILSIENPNNPDNQISFSVDPNPDWEGGDSGYPYVNQSDFLPVGEIGTVSFFGEWLKVNDPQYLADLDEWTNNIEADGDLSNIEDEQALIAALVDFIESGVYSRDRFSQGSSTFLNDQDEESTVTFTVGEFSPGTSNSINVLVTDGGAIVTDEAEQNQQELSAFTNIQAEEITSLQSLLDSFHFVESTAVDITIQDSNGDGIIKTQLQKLNGYNFDTNWIVKSFSIDSSVNDVILFSNESPVDINLSNINFLGNPVNLLIEGNHGEDTIVGSSLADTIKGKNSDDSLSGFDGDDKIFGGRGNDTLNGGGGNDTLNGGEGNDTLNGGEGNDTLMGGWHQDTFVFGGTFINVSENITDNDTIKDFSNDFIDLTAFSLETNDLDSNHDGIVNAHDSIASLDKYCNLLIDLTEFNGGTINLEGVHYVSVEAFIL